jgi:hypothetical protein
VFSIILCSTLLTTIFSFLIDKTLLSVVYVWIFRMMGLRQAAPEVLPLPAEPDQVEP